MLAGDYSRVMAREDTQKRLAGLGMTAAADSPEDFDAFIKAEIAKWWPIIREAGLKAE